MKRQIIGLVAGVLVAMAVCPRALAQAAPPAADAVQQRIRMLDHIPADAVAFVMVGNLKEMCSKVDAFFREFAPPRAAKDFSFLKELTASRKFGEGFNPSGPIALALLDPVVYARDLAGTVKPATRPADEPQRAGGDAADRTKRDLPALYILSGKDVAKMFPELKVERDGDLFKISVPGPTTKPDSDDERSVVEVREPSWALEKDGLVYICNHKRILMAMPPKVSVLVRLTGGGERLALESDVMGWINRPKVDELKETAFGKIFWREVHIPVISDMVDNEYGHNPLSGPLWWFIVTRDELFRQGEHLMGGLTWTPQGPRVEFRICCKPGGTMAKALAAAQAAQGPLTAALPDKRFIFAYGIRKDAFANPPEVQKAQRAAFLKNSIWGETPKEKVQAIADLIAAVNPEVTGVEHWAGQISDGGPISIASVIHCRDAEALRKIVRQHLPAIETMLNLAMMQKSENEQERFKLSYQEANEPAEGQVKADVILASHAEMEKMLENEDMGAHLKPLLLKVFPGELRFRARLAAIDKNTLVITVGGGRKFLAEAVAAARANSSKLELSEDAREALAMLPANRFAVAMVDISSAVPFYLKAMMSVFGEMAGPIGVGVGGAAIQMKPAPPIVVALSVDKNDLVVTAHVPTKLFKRVVGAFTGMDEPPAEEEDDFPGAKPTTRPTSRPAGRGPAGIDRNVDTRGWEVSPATKPAE
jgi:hypothetical protein